MKLKLNKKKLKNLSVDLTVLPLKMTPQIGGGRMLGTTDTGPMTMQTACSANASEGGCTRL